MVEDVYHARALCAREARAAFALVSLGRPEVTLARWRAFVRRSERSSCRRRGLVAVSDRRGIIHALFTYEVSDGLTASSLRVSEIVVARLPGGKLPEAALAFVERLAREFASPNVQIEFGGASLSACDSAILARSGFRPTGTMFSRDAARRARDVGSAGAPFEA
jgi:hypothetical protein